MLPLWDIPNYRNVLCYPWWPASTNRIHCRSYIEFLVHIRENEGQLFTENDIEFLLRILTPSVTEKATNFLVLLRRSIRTLVNNSRFSGGG